jgi:hypothetical protein
MDPAPPLEHAVGPGWCPHLAILVPSAEEVMPALASFYGLGARRNGWLCHRALPGCAEADREALAAAGLDVASLEADGRMAVVEPPLETDPETWPRAWVAVLERALARGFDAVWWSRFPIGPGQNAISSALAFDRAWDEAFRGRPAVSLCVYIVDDVDDASRSLAPVHDGLLLPGPTGAELVRSRPPHGESDPLKS